MVAWPPSNMEVQRPPFQEESSLARGVCAPNHVSRWVHGRCSLSPASCSATSVLGRIGKQPPALRLEAELAEVALVRVASCECADLLQASFQVQPGGLEAEGFPNNPLARRPQSQPDRLPDTPFREKNKQKALRKRIAIS